MVICIELYSIAETGQQIGDEETYVIEAGGPRASRCCRARSAWSSDVRPPRSLIRSNQRRQHD